MGSVQENQSALKHDLETNLLYAHKYICPLLYKVTDMDIYGLYCIFYKVTLLKELKTIAKR